MQFIYKIRTSVEYPPLGKILPFFANSQFSVRSTSTFSRLASLLGAFTTNRPHEEKLLPPPTRQHQSKTCSETICQTNKQSHPHDHSNGSPARPQQLLRRSQRRAPPAPSSRHFVQASTLAPEFLPTSTPTARRSTANRGKIINTSPFSFQLCNSNPCTMAAP